MIDTQRVRSIFLEAVEHHAPDQWSAFLDRVCSDEPDLRQRVEVLLRAHEQVNSMLDVVAVPPVATIDQPTTESAGMVIGLYKLLEQIGEGGMGTVWMAQQTEPVKRLVALKLIKAGMDSKQVIARFEAERQALALMDHPNIARVLDAGTTGSGRPYFVMDLVKGVPITRYCDEHHFPPRQRLELFLPVCQAVQHAHQKGIIHRDLKPSNVLVALYDGTPVPKVIDFGVAKAAGQQLTEKTLVTGFGAVVGTLEYMSPEQTEVNQLDIDTRSDIYSLGVLLYELLTGSTPFTRKELEKAGMLEMLRVIREQEPARPSTKLSTADGLPTLAANRGTEPARLTRIVRGELDWIVMKALEKDRNHRYESANGFAQDVQRYLADEPVVACPPSAWYRLRKFARRNKAVLVVAGLIFFLLVLLGAGGGWVAFDRASRRAKASYELDLALQRAELKLDQGKRADARAALGLARRLASEAQPGPARDERLGELEQRLEAEEQDQQFVADYENIRLRVETQVDIVNNRFTREAIFPAVRELFNQYGIPFVDTPVSEAAARIQNRPEPVRHQLIAALYSCGHHTPKEETRAFQWSQALLETADTDQWRRKVSKAIVARDWEVVERLVRAADLATQPPGLLLQFAEIIPPELKAVRLDFLRRIQRASPADLWANHDLASELVESGRYREATRYLTAALALRPDSPGIYLNLGRCLAEVKETDAAISAYERCLVLAPHYFMAFINLSGLLLSQGRLQEALAVCNRAVAANPERAGAWSNRAIAYNRLGEYKKALADSNRAVQLDEKLAAGWANRGSAYQALGLYDKAIADCTKALELDEKCASAFAERGNSYFRRGEYKKALADCDRSLDLEPTSAFTWYTRGIVYNALGDRETALANCTKAVELAPGNPWTHYNLGYVLLHMDRTQDAIAAYRKAIAIDKDIAEFHCNLASALGKQGEFREALEEVRRGHELRFKRPNWPYPSAQWVRQFERLAELEERLPAFLSGKAEPASPEERIELAEVCVRKQLNRAGVRFYDEAFTPRSARTAPLIEAHRYNAACVVALAGCGRGKDADKLDDKERARLRQQALDWLRADLAAWQMRLVNAPDKGRPAVRQVLRYWKQDSDLAGVRGEALAKLPEAERQAWQRLWDDAAALLRRAEVKSSAEKK
jgi:serine/threonine protein kinase/Flp pilus assembly protein TadD